MTWKSGSAAAKSNGFWAQNHWEWHYFSTPRHSRQLLWIMALNLAWHNTTTELLLLLLLLMMMMILRRCEMLTVWWLERNWWQQNEMFTPVSHCWTVNGAHNSQCLGWWPTTACSRVFIHQRLRWLINQFADHILIRSISPESILTVQSFRL